MGEAFQEFLTRDGQVFKTNVELGKVNTKEYDLELLESAEQRVQRGTNKSIEKALNSIVHLRKGTGKGKKTDATQTELDEYGLSEDLFTPQQIKFIKDTIEAYHTYYDISTPYQRSGVTRLAKLECNINELEIQVARHKYKDDIDNLQKLQAMHGKLSNDLKLTTRQASDGDKGEDLLTNACIAFEERFRNDPFEFESIELRDRLQMLLVDNANIIVDLIKECPTFFHFRKALAASTDMKPSDIEEIGHFTLEQIFDFKKVKEDRDYIGSKNEMTRDENFIDREGEMGDE